MGGGGRKAYRDDNKGPEAKPDDNGDGYGKPRSMQEALATVNPHFREGREYQINCQRCALAYEEQRKGLAVEAQPNNDAELVRRGLLRFERGSSWNLDGGNFVPAGVVTHMNSYEGQHWDSIRRTTSLDNAVRELTGALEAYGNGARFMVDVGWKNGGGHVFNAEVVDGVAVFVDAQSNMVRDIRSTLGNVKLNGNRRTKYCRVDNLKLKDGVRDWAFVDIR